MAPWLTDGIGLSGRRAQSRVVFGPHETNLCEGRSIGSRLVAYYERRARGGAGIVVTENASIHPSDHPYERAPLAAECGSGWAATVRAVRPHGTLVLAGLSHTGGQGSSAYNDGPLWAPSSIADPATRELPMAMDAEHIDAVVNGFRHAARVAAAADVDGVEIDIGAKSLLRQFHSPLTNHRDDAYGDDPTLLTRRVLAAVRHELGPGRILAVRLCCDELAPWAGTTPTDAIVHVRALAPLLDLLTVVRGGPFSVAAYRPDGHTDTGFNRKLCSEIRASVTDMIPIVLQGSVIDAEQAQSALEDGVADLVEMTRAQIADPDLVATVRTGARPRPCLLCNQACLVRDDRNPTIGCVVEPASGHETCYDEPVLDGDGPALVVGAGVAGLEAARVLALRGFAVVVAERDRVVGGTVRRVQSTALPDWLGAQCRQLGVRFELGRTVDRDEVERAAGDGVVIVATGSVAALTIRAEDDSVRVLAPEQVYADTDIVGPVVVFDPIGGPTGTAVAERLRAAGCEVTVVTPDLVVGRQLDRTGDLSAANVRLQTAGIDRYRMHTVRSARRGAAVLANVVTGSTREVACATVIDCSHRLPDNTFQGLPVTFVGDCLAPRTIAEAVREGRLAALTAQFSTGHDRTDSTVNTAKGC